MAFTVHVENFQSLLDVTVEVQGLTVITGTNNSGKTALMRAIRGAFQNAKGTSFIRYGKTKSVVELSFDDGRKLRWEKGKDKGDKPTFIIDEGKPIYPGQAVPDEVRALGVRPIMAGGREIWPQFAPQFTGQVFLLDQPGSVLAEAVADVNRVSVLNEALRMAESDRRSEAASLKVRLVDQETLTAEVAQYEGLDAVEASIVALEADIAKTNRLTGAIQAAVVLQGRVQAAQKAVSFLEGVESVDIPSEQASRDLEDSLAKQEDLIRLHGKLKSSHEAVSKLQGIEAAEIPEDATTKGLQGSLDDLLALVAVQGRLAGCKALVDKYEGFPQVEEIDVSSSEKVLGVLTVLQGFWSRVLQARQDIDTLEGQAKATETELTEAQESISTLLEGMGECPLCGSTVEHAAHS